MKSEREPTQEEFEKLLAWLASAGRDYQTMHYRITRMFISGGCYDAERLADEVVNRVAARIDKVVSDYEGDPARCLRGFAENVAREDRNDRKKQIDIEWVEQSILPETREQEEEERQTRQREDACLAKCLAELTSRERNVFWRYFQDETQAKVARRRLAAELGITANALRIKAHRLSRRLRHCLEACLDEPRER
jgi:RNA polymerase sigma factor (sigma-70 family)